MLPGWIIFAAALGYIMLLFAIATYGDAKSRFKPAPKGGRPLVYALSLAIYCTSWTYFGGIGQTAEFGWEFLGIYTGPILLFTLGMPILRRVVYLAKSEKLTSVADFVAARYGKNATIASLVSIIALIGAIPYIALQLKAVTNSVAIMIAPSPFEPTAATQSIPDLSLPLTLLMAGFAIMFGTRHTDATEHQDGLILAISTESLVKLLAMFTAGIYVTFIVFAGPLDLWQKVSTNSAVQASLAHETSMARWVMLTFLSACAIILLPRQFHVTVVENRTASELNMAGYLLPAYLVAINLFVMPIAFAGLYLLGPYSDADLYILSVPLSQGMQFITLIAFIGGFSAATAMVIVASVALSIMISNDLIMPILLRQSMRKRPAKAQNFDKTIKFVRRISIIGVLCLGYAYHVISDSSGGLASIGLLAFAAIAQIAPPLIGGLVWRGANARGAIAGLVCGFASWIYLLFLPSIGAEDYSYLAAGLFNIVLPGLDVFAPQAPDLLFSSVLFCLLANCLGFIFGSLTRRPTAIERIQATIFVQRGKLTVSGKFGSKSPVTVIDLKNAIARYIGNERLDAAFKSYELQNGRQLQDNHPADIAFMRFCEQLLGSSIGASSARLVLSLVLQRAEDTSSETAWLLDQANEALLQNQDMLHTALSQMDQGIAVFDSYYELTIWNPQFATLLELPDHMIHIGLPLQDIIQHLERRGDLTPEQLRATFSDFLTHDRAFTLVLGNGKRILEVRSNPMHGKGIVATFTDVSQRVASDNALKQANETLEMRVDQRTSELTRVNSELAEARAAAEDANLGKTRFFAAAGHDILQPLNAARLYSSALLEQNTSQDIGRLASSIDSALESVETILGAVLDISRLDTGAMRANIQPVALSDLLRKVESDFIPIAREKNLRLVVMPTAAIVESDPHLLRRLIQNLVSNAIKYTLTGKVLVGVRQSGDQITLQVSDSGIGIPANMHRTIFKEFSRLDEGARTASGLGLGLSIVDRISRVLKHRVDLHSVHGKGTTIRVSIPAAKAMPQAQARQSEAEQSIIKNQLSGLKVACIDNEPLILEGMTLLLKGWGCEITTYNSIADVRSALVKNSFSPDIIIADYHLGDGEGIDAILLIRRHFMRSIPALLITADRSPEVRATAERLKIGMQHKPVKPAALRAYMNQMARGHKRIH